jgi:hypothetical protein
MRRLWIGGKVNEIKEHEYLNLIMNLAKGYYYLAKAYNNYHKSGFSDWKGTLQLPNVGQDEFNKAVIDQIDDDELFEAFNSLIDLVREMKEQDRNITNWLTVYAGLTAMQGKKGKTLLERRLKKIIANGPDKGPQGPIWVIQPEYQALIERSRKIMVDIDKIHLHIDQRIRHLLERYSGA